MLDIFHYDKNDIHCLAVTEGTTAGDICQMLNVQTIMVNSRLAEFTDEIQNGDTIEILYLNKIPRHINPFFIDDLCEKLFK